MTRAGDPPYTPNEKFTAISLNTGTESNGIRSRPNHLPHPTPGSQKRFAPRRSLSFTPPHTYLQWKRTLSRPLIWFIMIVFLLIWYSRGTVKDLNSPEVQARLKELFPPEITKHLRYWPASHNRIHVRGANNRESWATSLTQI